MSVADGEGQVRFSVYADRGMRIAAALLLTGLVVSCASTADRESVRTPRDGERGGEVSQGSIPAEDLAWVVEHFPEVAKYVPDPELGHRLVSWVQANAQAFDRTCTPLQLVREGDKLVAAVNVETKIAGQKKTVSSERLELGRTLVVNCGGTDEFEKTSDGRWRKTTTQPRNCEGPIEHQLAEVVDDAVYYDGAPVALSVECAHTTEVQMTCLSGGERVCKSCSLWKVRARSLLKGYGIGYVAKPTEKKSIEAPQDCGVACPLEDSAAAVGKANVILEGNQFMTRMHSPPVLFRSKAACTGYWAKYPEQVSKRRNSW